MRIYSASWHISNLRDQAYRAGMSCGHCHNPKRCRHLKDGSLSLSWQSPRWGKLQTVSLQSGASPCCFKQCVLPSDRRRVSPTAGAQRYQMRARGKRHGSSTETNQLLCAALMTLLCSRSVWGRHAFFSKLYTYFTILWICSGTGQVVWKQIRPR